MQTRNKLFLKYYAKVLLTIVWFALIWGFVAPALFSAASTFLVALGFIILVSSPLPVFFIWRKHIDRIFI